MLMLLLKVRWSYPHVSTYFVDYFQDYFSDWPSVWFENENKPDIDILGVDSTEYFLIGEMKKYPGWIDILGVIVKRGTTNKMRIWLKGFISFYKDIIKNDLPSYQTCPEH